MPPTDIDIDSLRRFRTQIIDAFAAMELEIQAITATINELDPCGPTRLVAKREVMLMTRENLRAHFERAISPL